MQEDQVLQAVTAMLRTRTKVMGDEGLPKLALECSEADRARLEEHPQYEKGTTERWAWHAGYVAAMNDALRMIDDEVTEYPMVMGPAA